MAHSWTKKCTNLEPNYHFSDIIEMLATLLAEFSMKAEDIENYLSLIPTVKTVQTIARAYQQICAGEEPWIALGNFRNAWYGYAKDNRLALVGQLAIA